MVANIEGDHRATDVCGDIVNASGRRVAVEDAKAEAILIEYLLYQPAYGPFLGPDLAVIFLTEPQRMSTVIEQAFICRPLACITRPDLKLAGFIDNPMPRDKTFLAGIH